MKFLPLYIVFILTCSIISPTGSLAPDINTTTKLNGNKIFIDQLNSYIEKQTLNAWINKPVYHNPIEENATFNKILFKKNPNQVVNYQEEFDSQEDPFDSYNIWRTWYQLGN